MELLQLRYFVHAAETQNFTKTAVEYGVPTSNISQTIRKLEAELSTRLFDRLGNRVELNENGKVFYSHISTAVTAVDNGRRALRERKGYIDGKLQILALANRDLVSVCFSKFHEEYPCVELIQETNVRRSLFSDFDLIIAGDDPRLAGYEKRLLLDDVFMMAVAANGKYANQKVFTKEMARTAEYTTLMDGTSFNQGLEKLSQELKFKPNIALVSEDPYYVIKYVDTGLGVAYLPSKTWTNRLGSNIVLLPVQDVTLSRQTYLYRNSKRLYTNACKYFAQMLMDVSAQL